MAKCANCEREADYRYVIVEPFGTNYCQYDLPSFLYTARDQGILPAPVDDLVEEAVVEETPKVSKRRTSIPVVDEVIEEPVVEEVPAEEAPVEEPTGE
jgi:hypothetical protein